ncbi:MAG: MjaI family restriction endonuclease [Desulfobacterales bacterium]|nr:MjaI family restriction endonuclease [Desulfobacterales bacterium]
MVEDIGGEIVEFPKYTTQLINLANQNAGGTRPKVVGQMSELIEQFPGRLFHEWETWCLNQMPNAIEDATAKIIDMIERLRMAMELIDEDMVRKWVTDLVLTKTFTGLKFQESILKRVASRYGKKYRRSSPAEESKAIDGFIGDEPVSIKPITYKSKNMYQERIGSKMIFYDKKKDGVKVEWDFEF